MSGECQTRNANDYEDDSDDEVPPLDEADIALLKTYGLGPYSTSIKAAEEEIRKHQQKVKDLIGIKESDTGLSQPSQWDLVGDKQMMSEEAPLQVARCTKSSPGRAPRAERAAVTRPALVVPAAVLLREVCPAPWPAAVRVVVPPARRRTST